MTFRSIIKLFIPNFLLKIYRNRFKHETIKKFSFDVHSTSDVKKDIQEKYGHNSELLELFANNKDFTVHKWHHYIPIYDRYFSSFQGQKIRFLEIGVGEGGSLRMWRKYFGNNAIIFGIDINPECKKYNTPTEQVKIGSQTDEIFLQSVIKEMGGRHVIKNSCPYMFQKKCEYGPISKENESKEYVMEGIFLRSLMVKK